MSEQSQIEALSALREAQNKYIYFILGISGAAMALSVNQTKESSLAWSQMPLAIAVILWGLSFFYGCLNRLWTLSALSTNAGIFEVAAGKNPIIGNHPIIIQEGTKILDGIFEKQSNKAAKYAEWQFKCLIAGAISYLIWHILEMYLRIPTQTP